MWRRSSLRPSPMNSPLASRFSLNSWLIACRYQRPGRSIGFSYQLSKVSRLARKARIVDMLVQIDVILDVVLLGVHVLPALQHELALHQAAAEPDQFVIERGWRGLRHALDRTVARVGVDRRSGEHQRMKLLGESGRQHGGEPTALAEADQVHASTQVVDRDKQFGEVVVDVEILHVLGRRLPVGQHDVPDAVGQERLDQALTLVIVGDHCRVARMGASTMVGMPPGSPYSRSSIVRRSSRTRFFVAS